MLPDRVSNPGPLTYESGALPIALRGPAKNVSGSNTEGSFTTAVSNSFLSPWEKSIGCRFWII